MRSLIGVQVLRERKEVRRQLLNKRLQMIPMGMCRLEYNEKNGSMS